MQEGDSAGSGEQISRAERLLREARPPEPETFDRGTRTVVFLDLAGSTARKLERGHSAGVIAALTHNRFCRLLVEVNGGQVLKEIGDGVLAVFEDSLDAVLAANEIRNGFVNTDLSTKIGMTSGMVDLVQIDGRDDILGSTVDRAARIQSTALPNQVLFDHAQLTQVQDYLRDHEEIWIDGPESVSLRGIGNLDLWSVESSTAEKAKPTLPQRLRVYGGRLRHTEKLRFMNYAESEIIELGLGLTTFVNYFESLAEEEWRKPVLEILRKGVDIRCYAFDCRSEIAAHYFAGRGEDDYPAKAEASLEQLRHFREELNGVSDAGKIELFSYQSMPSSYVLGVDLDAERSGIQVSPYLPGVRRADCPVVEVSRKAEPALFGRVRESIKSQIHSALQLD